MSYAYILLATSLCIHGHPAPRNPHLTYGGLKPLHGYQRDHFIPPELGGADTPDNVHYQQCDKFGRYMCLVGPAGKKDIDEHVAGEKMCSGKWTQDYAIQWLQGRWSVDAAHGYKE